MAPSKIGLVGCGILGGKIAENPIMERKKSVETAFVATTQLDYSTCVYPQSKTQTISSINQPSTYLSTAAQAYWFPKKGQDCSYPPMTGMKEVKCLLHFLCVGLLAS
ncbi:uncharacterized protein LOC143244617 isoform X9 [Tachypleus tridentatus]|uniref:uncharacterized protein LOC143244617 isoform X9 n=1 Tax=Tachypleus tridentatus TaxID=6853 RepID=UPI003FD630E7